MICAAPRAWTTSRGTQLEVVTAASLSLLEMAVSVIAAFCLLLRLWPASGSSVFTEGRPAATYNALVSRQGSPPDFMEVSWGEQERGKVVTAGEEQAYTVDRRKEAGKERGSSSFHRGRTHWSSRTSRQWRSSFVIAKTFGIASRFSLTVSLIAGAILTFWKAGGAFLECFVNVRAPGQSGVGSTPRLLAVATNFDDCIELVPNESEDEDDGGDDAVEVDEEVDDDLRSFEGHSRFLRKALVANGVFLALVAVALVVFFTVTLTDTGKKSDSLPSNRTAAVNTIGPSHTTEPPSNPPSRGATSVPTRASPGTASESNAASTSVSVSPSGSNMTLVSPSLNSTGLVLSPPKGTDLVSPPSPHGENNTQEVIVGEKSGGVMTANVTIADRSFLL
ncbi:hypothetical protein CSUI_009501 [Cystoisospora suis]|uniref:Transmembrane protein n=1 Tax=Cystoisospora suis TaxID=483139 RepID=A0A2C6JH11_9APIC|nr:hypothetical protein CSUI_009501 [Cystoisospora suis]